ncbi:helix-turn-helix transcriptional regulator [Saccharospirillum salsuginis]|uniref:Transcriptional regulator n=1 Tax=Saccharospirillum salsuginis TaxID=418750 RepID=A0A918KRZ3_9GAMM|nr:helix-turn-helix transcriptional regulator [Saccharospirillum salsuginis]GGX72024.1 transcriptional regulator [Saccharospirillum salsuginis]
MLRLKYYRVSAGLTQGELGKRCGFKSAQSRVALYESGERLPPLPVARRIVKVLNDAGAPCTLDEVFPPETTVKRRTPA